MEFLPEADEANENDEPDLETYFSRMIDVKKSIFGQVHGNIQKAQNQQKVEYDRRHAIAVVGYMWFNG